MSLTMRLLINDDAAFLAGIGKMLMQRERRDVYVIPARPFEFPRPVRPLPFERFQAIPFQIGFLRWSLRDFAQACNAFGERIYCTPSTRYDEPYDWGRDEIRWRVHSKRGGYRRRAFIPRGTGRAGAKRRGVLQGQVDRPRY